MSGRILIVDDDEGFARVLSRSLQRLGHDVMVSGTALEARTILPSSDVDVVVLDYHLPDADGLALLDELRPLRAGAVFMMATAYPELDVAVEAMRRGAFDYVAKGAELEECLIRIERGVEVALLRRRMAEASRTNTGAEPYGLIGESAPMRALRDRLAALGGADQTTVLILGETGTGKGVVARAIHAASGRAYEPFIAVDCTTIPATLVESELFGYEKGAFSGATGSKMGRVEAAGRGTLFLDEIGELELPMQAKLLRLLEEREFTRVGSTRTRTMGARIITATNRNLERAVAEGWFRADLRYRLEVFVVELPALRDRGDDVFLLIAHFGRERARAIGKPEPRLHPKVIEVLSRYPFPGNVRELRNMVEQAVLLAKGEELTLDEFPVLTRSLSGSPPRDISTAPPEGRPTTVHRPLPPRNAGPAMTYGSGFGPTAATRTYPMPPPPLAMPANGTTPAPVSTDPPTWHDEGGEEGASTAPSHPTDGTRTVPPKLAEIRQAARTNERRALVQALEDCGGNVSAAARALGLSRYQILRRLRKHGLR